MTWNDVVKDKDNRTSINEKLNDYNAMADSFNFKIENRENIVDEIDKNANNNKVHRKSSNRLLDALKSKIYKNIYNMNRKDKVKMQKIHESKDIHNIKGITKKQNCAKIELKKDDINSIKKGQDRKRQDFGYKIYIL